jgi:adenosylcobinamide-GDP ribazoletransferase
MWPGLLSALRFLTILPLGRDEHFDPHKAIPFFPLAGIVIGLALIVVDRVAVTLWSPATAALLDLLFLAAISGGLHLDGLADTADGMYGRRAPQRALEIMKDSRIGAIGMLVTVSCLAVKWAGLAGIDHQRAFCLLVIPAFARASVLFAMVTLPYGRPQGGTGHAFFAKPLSIGDFWGIALVVTLSLLTGWKLFVLNTGFVLLVAALVIFYRRRMGCVTGDMLGAMIEICEAVLFLLAAAGGRP